MLEADKTTLLNEKLMELQEGQSREAKEEPEPEPRRFTVKKMQQGFSYTGGSRLTTELRSYDAS